MSAVRRSCAVLGAAIIVMLPLVAGSQPPTGFADNVLGRWNITVADADTEYPAWLEVRLRTESQLMGRFVGRFGSVRHLSEISFADGMLRFTAPLQYEPGSRPLRFAATRSEDRLTGTMTDPDGRTLQWIGTPAPTLVRRNEGSPQAAVALFNGHDLNGWRARVGNADRCWQVVDGDLLSTPPCMDIVTEREFEDFVLDLEFSIPRGSNSGIYLRGRYEVQIQDTAGQALDALRMGAVYGFIAPTVDAAGAPESWQSMTIRLLGREITVVLNGTTIIDAESIPGITGGALDSNESRPGPIMIQGDHGAIRFRKFELTPLSHTTE